MAQFTISTLYNIFFPLTITFFHFRRKFRFFFMKSHFSFITDHIKADSRRWLMHMPAPAAAIKLLAAATFFPKTVAVRRTLKQAGSEPEERSEFIFHILVFLFQPPYVSGSRNTRDQIGDAGYCQYDTDRHHSCLLYTSLLRLFAACFIVGSHRVESVS